MTSEHDLLDGIFAFRLSKEMYISASGKIHRNPKEGRVHLPVNSIIAVNVPENQQWSGVRIAPKQFYRLTSENKIRLHRHYKEGLIEIQDYDIVCGFPPTQDENAINNNLVRKFSHFLLWLGEKEAKKYNAYREALIAEHTESIPSLSDIKDELDKEDKAVIDEEYEEFKCDHCQGKCHIYNIETHRYEECLHCKPSDESEDDIGDDVPF